MSTLENRPDTALLVVDVQNDVVADAWDRDAVVGRIADVVERARAADVPVVWVQHAEDDNLVAESDGWQIVSELSPADGEDRVHKRYGDAFEDTDLGDVLERLRVGRLVVCGAETDACIRSTVHGAFTRGYDVTLVGDAHTAGDRTPWGAPPPEQVVAHLNLSWRFHDAPGRTAVVVDAAALGFAD